MSAGGDDLPGRDERLEEAAAVDEPFELVVAVCGKVQRALRRGADWWRIRMKDGRVVTFHARAVVACTPVRKPARRVRG